VFFVHRWGRTAPLTRPALRTASGWATGPAGATQGAVTVQVSANPLDRAVGPLVLARTPPYRRRAAAGNWPANENWPLVPS
jgi:hypothetical protein